jgi:hypothetical protein
MRDIGADCHCRKCGDELSVDEYGNDECDVCAAGCEPWESTDFYCEEEDGDE